MRPLLLFCGLTVFSHTCPRRRESEKAVPLERKKVSLDPGGLVPGERN